MVIKVMTVQGNEFTFSEASNCEYLYNGIIFRVDFVDNKISKSREFPTVNIETIEKI